MMMNNNKAVHQLITILFLIATVFSIYPVLSVQADEPVPPVQPEPAAKVDLSEGQPGISPARTASSDSFGYVINSNVTPAWIDLTPSGVGGTQVNFPNPKDDETSDPISIGFNFKFYENAYTELYVSTNGLINFGQGSTEYVNRPIPRDTKPDNLIAPFWDDLKLQGDSQVYTYAGNGPSGKYFVIEWYQVTRYDSYDQLTFEVILHENGNIVFQYQQLNGVIDEATVGIEDSDGLDGLLYLFNSSGLNVSKAIQFTRPSPGPRVKLTPKVISGFTNNRIASMAITVVNTGEQGTDRYNLTVSGVIPPGWSFGFTNAATGTALADTNQDGKIDTGPVAQGSHSDIYLNVTAPSTAESGDTVNLNLIAASSLSASKTASGSVQVAVPAPFAQAVFDSYAGMRLQLIWKQNQVATRLTEKQFTGSNLSIVSLPDRRYFYAWEKNNVTTSVPPVSYTNLEYAVLNHYGAIIKQVSPLTNNSNVTIKTEDRSLYMAGLTNGRVGAVWVRTQTQRINQVTNTNINIFFSILTSAGQTILPPTNVTNITDWRAPGNSEIPTFSSPRIAASGGDRFILSWTDNHSSASDIYFAIFDQGGSSLKGVTKLTNSVPSGNQYNFSTPVSLANTNVLLAYVVTNNDVSGTVYRMIDHEGNQVLAETPIPGSAGSTPDGIQINNGVVLLAWNVPGLDELQYVALSGANFTNRYGPITIQNPKGRVAGVVSVTRDEDGHGILTWSEAEQFEYLSYALVDTNGDLLTQPMIFSVGLGDQPKIDTNTYGVGNAYYGGSWQVYLPITQR